MEAICMQSVANTNKIKYHTKQRMLKNKQKQGPKNTNKRHSFDHLKAAKILKKPKIIEMKQNGVYPV